MWALAVVTRLSAIALALAVLALGLDAVGLGTGTQPVGRPTELNLFAATGATAVAAMALALGALAGPWPRWRPTSAAGALVAGVAVFVAGVIALDLLDTPAAFVVASVAVLVHLATIWRAWRMLFLDARAVAPVLATGAVLLALCAISAGLAVAAIKPSQPASRAAPTPGASAQAATLPPSFQRILVEMRQHGSSGAQLAGALGAVGGALVAAGVPLGSAAIDEARRGLDLVQGGGKVGLDALDGIVKHFTKAAAGSGATRVRISLAPKVTVNPKVEVHPEIAVRPRVVVRTAGQGAPLLSLGGIRITIGGGGLGHARPGGGGHRGTSGGGKGSGGSLPYTP